MKCLSSYVKQKSDSVSSCVWEHITGSIVLLEASPRTCVVQGMRVFRLARSVATGLPLEVRSGTTIGDCKEANSDAVVDPENALLPIEKVLARHFPGRGVDDSASSTKGRPLFMVRSLSAALLRTLCGKDGCHVMFECIEIDR
jgi:hypothetical protein